jgi:hypothetical protein
MTDSSEEYGRGTLMNSDGDDYFFNNVPMSSSDDEEDDNDVIVAVDMIMHEHDEMNKARYMGSVKGRAKGLDGGREAGHVRLYKDYFQQKPIFPPSYFRRHLQMSRKVFMRILRGVRAHDEYFTLTEPQPEPPASFENFMKVHNEMRDSATHNQFQLDLVEHMWTFLGNLMAPSTP